MDNNCYMTLVTDEKYLPCVKRCNFLMNYYHNKFPYIVLAPEGNLDIQQELKAANIKFIPTHMDKFTHKYYGNYHVYADTINKFQVFNFTEYDKICFIDADMVVRGGTDYLFEDLAEDAQTCFYSSYDDRNSLVGELFIVRPDPTFYEKVLSEKDKYTHDEAVINEYFHEQYQTRFLVPCGPLLHFSGPVKVWEKGNTTFPELRRMFFEQYTSNKDFIRFVEDTGKWHGRLSLWSKQQTKIWNMKLYAVLIHNKQEFEKAIELERKLLEEYGIQFEFIFIMGYRDSESIDYFFDKNKYYIFTEQLLSEQDPFEKSLRVISNELSSCAKICFIYNLNIEISENLDYLFSEHLSQDKREQALEKYQNDLFLYTNK